MIASVEKSGRILTFYSFKGGSGRTMALANQAVLLARAGLGFAGNKVLMIDWDLEAPGLHEFFKDNLPDQHEHNTGVIDLFMEINERFPSGIKEIKDYPAIEAQIREFFEKSVVRLKQKRTLPEQTESSRSMLSEDIWLLKAGHFSEFYPINVQTFDWRGFFSRNHAFFPLLIEYLEKTYDYVLIDSRTGLTDSGGICTSILPEALVAVFTPTNQGLRVTEVVQKAVNYRKGSDDLRPLVVYPLASRIDTSAEGLNSQWKSIYVPRFEQLFKDVYHLKECDLRKYFGKIEVHYVKDLAYGESVAVLANSDTVNVYELPARYNELVQLIVGEYLPWEMPELIEPPHLLSAATHVSFAEQLAANKEFKRAERHFEKALQPEEEPIAQYYPYTAFAHYFEGHGEMDKAEAIYDDLIRNVPFPISFHAFVGFLLHSKKDYQKAKRVAEVSLKQERSPSILSLYAEVLTKLSLVEEAEKVYLEAIEANPKDIEGTIASYASFLRDTKKDYEKSAELFKKLIKEDDEPETWRSNLAQVLLLQGKKEEADTVIKSVLSQNLDAASQYLLCLLWFLRLAYFPEWYEKSLHELEGFLEKGIRFPRRDFAADIEVAEKNKHPHLEKIKEMAARITETLD